MTQFVATGLNYRSAPVELRERFAITESDLPAALESLCNSPSVHEAVILSTCNRVEFYTVEDRDSQATTEFINRHYNIPPAEYADHTYRYTDEKAVRHLLSVAASLDAMIVGEPQILGQVKDQFLRAQAAGSTGRILNQLFSRALAFGKRVRTETAIGQLAVSVPYAAVELAKKVFDSLNGKTAALLGRGKMSELTALHLRRAGVSHVYVVNRDYDNAVEFARKVDGMPILYDDELSFLLHSDILICSTRAPHHLVTPAPLKTIMSRRRNRMLFLVDISVPRRIDPAVSELENVYLFNIDNLENIVDENRRLRMDEARKASALIEGEVEQFLAWTSSLKVVPTIRAFREHLDSVRAEVEGSLLGDYEGFTPEQRERIEQFSRTLINKIGHFPTVRLKESPSDEQAVGYSKALRDLFDLEVEETPKAQDEPDSISQEKRPS